MLYLVAVTEGPTADEAKKGKKEKVVVEPKVMVGGSTQQVTKAMLMSGDIPKSADPSRTLVVTIPFAAASV